MKSTLNSFVSPVNSPKASSPGTSNGSSTFGGNGILLICHITLSTLLSLWSTLTHLVASDSLEIKVLFLSVNSGIVGLSFFSGTDSPTILNIGEFTPP